MNKSTKIAICILICIIISFVYYYIVNAYILNKNEIVILSLTPFIIIILFLVINKIIETNNYKKIKKVSNNYKLLCELNTKYSFVKLNDLSINEKEYSIRGISRADASNIIQYYIENNNYNIREYILKLYDNKIKYDNYIKEYNSINNKTSIEDINKAGFSENKFYKLEKKLLEKEKISDKVYKKHIIISIHYSNSRAEYIKNRTIDYQKILEIYKEWENGKKYVETSKRERKLMNDKLRYDVLKRDNFTCQKCGASVKDGVKLQIDHIIPISKGGKTTLSNLQTLCDRCNIGKGTQDN